MGPFRPYCFDVIEAIMFHLLRHVAWGPWNSLERLIAAICLHMVVVSNVSRSSIILAASLWPNMPSLYLLLGLLSVLTLVVLSRYQPSCRFAWSYWVYSCHFLCTCCVKTPQRCSVDQAHLSQWHVVLVGSHCERGGHLHLIYSIS